MNLPRSFSEAIKMLGPNMAFEILQGWLDSSLPYALERVLPSMQRATYDVSNATIRVVPTLVPTVGMDSPTVDVGYMDGATFLAQTAKFGGKSVYSEEMFRNLDDMMMRAQNQVDLRNVIADWAENVLIQGLYDSAEMIRGRALANGAIDMTFGKQRINIDFQVPATQQFALRTTALTNAYGAANSVFWEDYYAAQNIHGLGMETHMSHNTWQAIRNNQVNNIAIVSTEFPFGRDGGYMVVQISQYTDTTRQNVDNDPYRRAEIHVHSREAEYFAPDRPDTTTRMKFFPDGKVSFVKPGGVGRPLDGLGAAPDIDWRRAVGYFHWGPTVEGRLSNMALGPWMRLRVPEDSPERFEGEIRANMMAAITAPNNIVLAETQL